MPICLCQKTEKKNENVTVSLFKLLLYYHSVCIAWMLYWHHRVRVLFVFFFVFSSEPPVSSYSIWLVWIVDEFLSKLYSKLYSIDIWLNWALLLLLFGHRTALSRCCLHFKVELSLISIIYDFFFNNITHARCLWYRLIALFFLVNLSFVWDVYSSKCHIRIIFFL